MAAVNLDSIPNPNGTGVKDFVLNHLAAWKNWKKIWNQFQVYNVLDYGAKGDGVTDDGPAIQRAFTAARAVGGTVVFPGPGTYRCSSQWDLTGIRVKGAGMGTGSAQQTVVQFFGLGTSAAIITRLASTSTYLTTSLSNIRIEANSWDAVTGCRGYGLDLEARLTIDNVLVYAFYKSNVYFHGGVAGSGPYNSRIKNLYSTNSKEHGILVGTGANNLTFQEPYCAYNGSPSFGVAPTVSGLYDGFHIERDNDGNPGSVYQSYVPESLVILGGNCFANSRYGWNLQQVQNSNITLGYCEENYGAAGDGKQVNLGIDLTYCTVNIPTIQGGVANVQMSASYYRYNNIVICQGSLLCYNNENYMLSNLQNYLGYTGDPYGAGITDGAYVLYDNNSLSATYKQLLIRSFGTAKLIFGGTNHVEYNGSNIVMPAFFGVLDANGGVYRNTGSPENSNYAEKGSIYLRADSAGEAYLKTTTISFKTGWKQIVIIKSNPTFGDGSASAFVSIDSGDGNNSDIGFLNAGTELWTLRNENAISGGATGVGGAQLSFLARKNDQSLSDRTLILDRDPAVAVKITRDLALTVAGKGVSYQAGPIDLAGSADPEGSVTAATGSTYRRTNGTLYIKASGSGNTGWVALAPVASPTFTGTVLGVAATWSGTQTVNADLKLGTAGNGVYIKEGANATMGVATLTAGSVTVSTTKVTANSRIHTSIQSLGTVAAPKAIGVTARTAGTSFTITSADATDTSVIAWQIVEPA